MNGLWKIWRYGITLNEGGTRGITLTWLWSALVRRGKVGRYGITIHRKLGYFYVSIKWRGKWYRKHN